MAWSTIFKLCRTCKGKGTVKQDGVEVPCVQCKGEGYVEWGKLEK